MTARLSVQGITHSYGKKPALNNVGFTLEKGSFCALLGPNGAGKSTLFSILTRLFVPDAGDVSVAGHSLSRAPGKALAQIGVVFQQPTLDLDLTVRRNLKYFAALHGISGTLADARIKAVLERVSMSERMNEKVRALNGGHRRRMEIARALIHEPQVLLLDEPTVGLDAATRHAITAHVHDLANAQDLTVLWATHLVDEVRDDDRLIVLHQGIVLADGSAAGIADGMTLQSRFLEMTGAGE